MPLNPLLRLLGGLAFGFLLFVVTPTASGMTRKVPENYPSIQNAIDVANNGDSVVVSPGIYRENITIAGKYITVTASDPDVNNTVIAGNPGRTPVMIQSVPYNPSLTPTTVSGFKITGGYAPSGQGGGITIANNADPIIKNNDIEHNHALSHGGGILIYNNSNPTIKINTIQNNIADFFGGGIFAVKNSQPVIASNKILGNRATGQQFSNGGSSGGGIYLENDPQNISSTATPVVLNNTISGNSADFAGGGIMLRTGISAVLQFNDVSNNTASYGGGIHIETEGTGPKVLENTISGNTATASLAFQGSGYGGGISVYSHSTPAIIRNTIQSNRATTGGAGISLAESSYSTIDKNIIGYNVVTGTDSPYSGGGIYAANANANVTNNEIASNQAQLGGGIALMDGSHVSIINNTLAKNQAFWSQSPAAGGALFVRGVASVTAKVTNNIFALNNDYQIFEENVTGSLDHNVIVNDSKGMYFDYTNHEIHSATALDSISAQFASNNVDGAPGFVDGAAGMYRLSPGSVAIDSGNPYSGTADDLSNNLRPVGNGIDCGAYEFGSSTSKTSLFRFINGNYHTHFYTADINEFYSITANNSVGEWQYEPASFDVFAQAVTGTSFTPVYRFLSPSTLGHFYTTNQGERDYIRSSYPSSVWTYEGATFNVYSAQFTGPSRPAYRFYSPKTNDHFYTVEPAERAALQKNTDWNDEGTAFSVPR